MAAFVTVLRSKAKDALTAKNEYKQVGTRSHSMFVLLPFCTTLFLAGTGDAGAKLAPLAQTSNSTVRGHFVQRLVVMSHLTCQSRHGSPSWLPVVPSIRPPDHLVSSLSKHATLPQTFQARTNHIGKHRPESMPIVNMLSGSTL